MREWLAEKSDHGEREIFGVYASPEDAKQRCRNDSTEYFGEKTTPPLKWLGDDRYCSASHYDPRGNVLYQVTRYEVEEGKQ